MCKIQDQNLIVRAIVCEDVRLQETGKFTIVGSKAEELPQILWYQYLQSQSDEHY